MVVGPGHMEERAENLSSRRLKPELIKKLVFKVETGFFEGFEGFQ